MSMIDYLYEVRSREREQTGSHEWTAGTFARTLIKFAKRYLDSPELKSKIENLSLTEEQRKLLKNAIDTLGKHFIGKKIQNNTDLEELKKVLDRSNEEEVKQQIDKFIYKVKLAIYMVSKEESEEQGRETRLRLVSDKDFAEQSKNKYVKIWWLIKEALNDAINSVFGDDSIVYGLSDEEDEEPETTPKQVSSKRKEKGEHGYIDDVEMSRIQRRQEAPSEGIDDEERQRRAQIVRIISTKATWAFLEKIREKLGKPGKLFSETDESLMRIFAEALDKILSRDLHGVVKTLIQKEMQKGKFSEEQIELIQADLAQMAGKIADKFFSSPKDKMPDQLEKLTTMLVPTEKEAKDFLLSRMAMNYYNKFKEEVIKRLKPFLTKNSSANPEDVDFQEFWEDLKSDVEEIYTELLLEKMKHTDTTLREKLEQVEQEVIAYLTGGTGAMPLLHEIIGWFRQEGLWQGIRNEEELDDMIRMHKSSLGLEQQESTNYISYLFKTK